MPANPVFTIGCDPEYLFVNPDTQAISSAGGSITNTCGTRFGSDGALAELRPPPAESPLGLVRNIRKLLAEGLRSNTQLRTLKWIAPSCHGSYACGGHIHLGDAALRAEKNIPCESLVIALNAYCAPLSLLLEPQKEAAMRRTSPYGRLGDVRTDHTWGIEYRTFSTWLRSPRIAFFHFAMTYVVTNEVLNWDLKESSKPYGSRTVSSLVPSATHFATASRDEVMEGHAYRVNAMKKFHLYGRYRRTLDAVIDSIERGLTSADLCKSDDMKDTWRIKTPTRIPMKLFLRRPKSVIELPEEDYSYV